MLLASGPVLAGKTFLSIDTLLVCPDQVSLKARNYSLCEERAIRDVPLTGKSLWVEATFVNDGLTDPLGLFISANAASRVYLNEMEIGSNGSPSVNENSEIPGMMDTVIFLPGSLLKPEQNTLMIHLSNHHSIVDLKQPLSRILITKYIDPKSIILKRYWLPLITFGVFLLGAIYFGNMAFKGFDKLGTSLLALMSLFALAQLFAETSRGVINYSYPHFELRLLSITFFAYALGLCLIAYVALRTHIKLRSLYILLIFVVISSIVLLTPGFDAKTIAALTSSACVSLAFAGYAYFVKKQNVLSYLLALILFLILIWISPSYFLDLSVFFIVAAMLTFLFVKQANILAEIQRLHLLENERVKQLKFALLSAKKQTMPSMISVKTAGKTSLISTDRIIYCKGAGDYVELHVKDQSNITLYTGSIGQIEKELPPEFLRIHRSYLVKTAFITSLERQSSGNGILVLKNDMSVPVSRRIMPKVKDAIG
jgi:DNA-binding LytR/AlgR family response regulator